MTKALKWVEDKYKNWLIGSTNTEPTQYKENQKPDEMTNLTSHPSQITNLHKFWTSQWNK